MSFSAPPIFFHPPFSLPFFYLSLFQITREHSLAITPYTTPLSPLPTFYSPQRSNVSSLPIPTPTRWAQRHFSSHTSLTFVFPRPLLLGGHPDPPSDSSFSCGCTISGPCLAPLFSERPSFFPHFHRLCTFFCFSLRPDTILRRVHFCFTLLVSPATFIWTVANLLVRI